MYEEQVKKTLPEDKKKKTHVTIYPIDILECYSDEDLIKLYRYDNRDIQFTGGYEQYKKLQERLERLGLK